MSSVKWRQFCLGLIVYLYLYLMDCICICIWSDFCWCICICICIWTSRKKCICICICIWSNVFDPSPVRYDDILSSGTLEINLCEIMLQIQILCVVKICWKMLSAKQWPFYKPWCDRWAVFFFFVFFCQGSVDFFVEGPELPPFEFLRAPSKIIIFKNFLTYHQTSNISHTLVGNKIVDHSDVVGALPVGAAPTTSFLT